MDGSETKFINIIDLLGNFELELVELLNNNNYKVSMFTDKATFFESFDLTLPDLILLNIDSFNVDIFSICSKVRAKSTIPFIVISDAASEEQKITAMNLCCDDYLIRPICKDEFLAKLSALFRRIEFEGRKCNMNCSYNYGNVLINLKKHEVLINATSVYLTTKEYEVLIYLLENKNDLVHRDDLLMKIWGFENNSVETRAIDDCIKRLRKKLSDAGSDIIIETVRGYGFKVKL